MSANFENCAQNQFDESSQAEKSKFALVFQQLSNG